MKHRITGFTIDINGCKVFKECTTTDTSFTGTLHYFMTKHNHSFKTSFDVIAFYNNGEIAYIDTYTPNNTASLIVESYTIKHYNPKHKITKVSDDNYRIKGV